MPVLTVFSLPIAGYLAPAMGYIFPKTLLPPQFWSSPQRLHFMLEVCMQAGQESGNEHHPKARYLPRGLGYRTVFSCFFLWMLFLVRVRVEILLTHRSSIPASLRGRSLALSMATALFFVQDASKQEVSLFPKLLKHLAMLTASPRPNSSPQQLQYSTK